MRSLVLLSGGLDSTVLLAQQLNAGPQVEAISFDYGQRHRRELDAAHTIADYYNVTHHIVDLSALGTHLTSALTGHGGIPFGQYDEASMSATVVPNRNAVLLSVAAGIASARRIRSVKIAVHGGDHHLYADCRPEFIDAIDQATYLACDVRVHAPFVLWSKADIVSLGRQLGVPFDLTWSCYSGGDEPCERCGTCLERSAALA